MSITYVELCLDGADLLDDPSLRQGLVNLWSAEADEAGLEVGSLERLGTGQRDPTPAVRRSPSCRRAVEQYVLARPRVVCIRATY